MAISYVSAAVSLATAGSVALLFSILIWLAKLREKDPDHHAARELFFGALSGSLKITVIYFFIIPHIPSLGLSAALTSSFVSVFTGVNFILMIELIAYIYTHLVHAKRESLTIGILGGITRSEAITGSMVDLIKKTPEYLDTAVCVILTANSTMLVRNMLLLLLLPSVGLAIFFSVLPVILAMLIVSVLTVYVTYKKQDDIDLKLSPISLRSAVEIVIAFSAVSLASSYFGTYSVFGYYIVAAVGAFAGALPVIFSIIALLGYNAISVDVASNVFLIACTVAMVNDTLIAYFFKERELAAKLFLNEVIAVLAGIIVFLGLAFPKSPLLSSIPTPVVHLFLVLVAISIVSVIAWFYLSWKGRDSGEVAAGVFTSLFNLALIYFVLLPIAPKALFGFVDFSVILGILLVVIFLELFLFLATRLSEQADLTILGLVSGVVSAEGVTFSLSRQGIEDVNSAAKMIFAAKSSMFARNFLILAALSFQAAAGVWFLVLPLSALFYFLSFRTEAGDSSLKLKQSSIPSVLLLILLFTVALVSSKLALDYFGNYGLVLSIILVSFTGGIPPMLSLLSLFALGQISTGTMVQLLFISSAVVSINDPFICIVFRHPELAKELAKKQVFAFLFSLLVLYLVFFR